MQIETLESAFKEMPKEPIVERLGGIQDILENEKDYLKTRKDLEWGSPGGSVVESTCQ